MTTEAYEINTALFSDDEVYRYGLFRGWEEAKGNALFVMLNPSTADAERDDPTLRRCVAFARRWGYGSVSVVNLYGLRATDPKELAKHPDPVGPDTDLHVLGHAELADVIVCAWGNHGTERSQRMVEMLKAHGHTLWCLGLNQSGEPVHPLYQPGDRKPLPFFP